MTRTANIDYAISETLRAHPDWINTYASTIVSIIKTQMNSNNFTSSNGARQVVTNYKPIDFLKYALDELNNLFSAMTIAFPKIINGGRMTEQEWNSLSINFPASNRIIELIYELQKINGNIFSYYMVNQSRLFELIDVIFKVRFNPSYFERYRNFDASFKQGSDFRQKVDALAKQSPYYGEIQQKIEASYQPYTEIESINFNQSSINRCVREIISGTQVKYNHNDYALDGSLFATQDVGKVRHNQEDSTLIMTHPKKEEFKLLAVADGMGGAAAGEEVSNYIVKELSSWFSTLPPHYFESYKLTYDSLAKKVKEINQFICHKYQNYDLTNVNAGSTLVCAIVTRDITVVLNVGDSRAYIARAGDLKLVTEDESQVWNVMKAELAKKNRNITMEDISNLRFAPFNNRITRFIGDPTLKDIQIRLVNNDRYDRLLLFSDGVHDILSSEDIKIIANTTNPDQITKEIVATAISKSAELKDPKGNIIFHINPGKDNTTAAAYVRR